MGEGNNSCLVKYIETIRKTVTELSARHRLFLDTDPLIAFRGEPKDYAETRLTPSLFRKSSYVAKEAYLFELFCDYDIVSRAASNIEKAIETQHYASISRMLDISFDVLVALYFACAHPGEEDGFVFVFAFPEHYSPHSKYIEEFYTNVLDGKHIAYSRNFKVFSHSRTNDRIMAQKGGFIFFPGKEFHPINTCYYDQVRISKDDKGALLKDLEVLFQVNEAALFPEKGKIAEVIRKRFEGNTYTLQEVSNENEIDSLLGRVDHELKLLRAKGETQDKKAVLRWLRKEQDDLTSYVLTRSEAKDAPKLLEKINEGFKILQIRYKEDPDGE